MPFKVLFPERKETTTTTFYNQLMVFDRYAYNILPILTRVDVLLMMVVYLVARDGGGILELGHSRASR